jgi:hypothetical protein
MGHLIASNDPVPHCGGIVGLSRPQQFRGRLNRLGSHAFRKIRKKSWCRFPAILG